MCRKSSKVEDREKIQKRYSKEKGSQMGEIGQIFLNLGEYSGPVLIGLVELLAAVWLLGMFLKLNLREKRKRNLQDARDIYYSEMEEGESEIHIILRRRDYYPVFCTKNIKKMLGIEPYRLKEDIELLGTLVTKNEYRKIIKLYEDWNRKKMLQREIKLKDSGKWFMLEISSCKDERYDFLVLRDITSYKTHELELQEEIEEARNESQSKTTFLSKMSHEIRTPMNGIMGMLTLAKTKLKSESSAIVYLNKAEELLKFLLSLINDILDMSRIEAGRMELESKEFDIYEFADKLRNMFQKNVEEKGVAFRVNLEMSDDKTHYLIGDELRLSQVMINFLSNAMKFTSEGEIVVTIREMMRENNKVDLMMRVHDTGIGMERDFISRIFRPFEQESVEITKNYGGSGLGMAISDQIVRLMGGEIVIDSMPGRGSDFSMYISLPISEKTESLVQGERKANPETENEEYSYQGLNILMSEDNEVNAEIAVSILTMEGANVDLAKDGQEAVEKYQSAEPGKYDLILMDIQMPVMNGWDATKAIRAFEKKQAQGERIPIFALSADAFVEDQRHAIEAGMDGHFSKPINFDEMCIQIGKTLSERRERRN